VKAGGKAWTFPAFLCNALTKVLPNTENPLFVEAACDMIGRLVLFLCMPYF